MPHRIPINLPERLDLRDPPSKPSAASGYPQLLSLLEELGRRLDAGQVGTRDLRSWESEVMKHLHDREIDLFMRVSDETEFDEATRPEQRWKNLRAILLERKGISRRGVESGSEGG